MNKSEYKNFLRLRKALKISRMRRGWLRKHEYVLWHLSNLYVCVLRDGKNKKPVLEIVRNAASKQEWRTILSKTSYLGNDVLSLVESIYFEDPNKSILICKNLLEEEFRLRQEHEREIVIFDFI